MTLLARVKDWVRRLQALEPAWFQANSWLNESVGGIVPTLGLAWAFGPLWGVLAFNAISLSYEVWLDPWGWNLDDVGQRAAGSLLVGWLWGVT